MAIVLCLTCGAAAWFSCWLLVGGRLLPKVVADARLHALEHLLKRALARVSSARVVRVALGWDAFAGICARTRDVIALHGRTATQGELAVVLLLAIAVIGVVAGFWSRSAIAAVVVVCACSIFVELRHRSMREGLAHARAEAMPSVMRTMATALESGHTLVQAIDYVGLHVQGPVAEPFVRASLRLRCGMSVEATLDTLARELDAPGINLLVTALTISQRTGSPLRDLLRSAAVLLEQQEGFGRMLRVRTAQVRLSVRVVCSLPILMVCLLALISPDFQRGLASPTGIACLLVSAAMDGVALLAIRRIMKGVL